jgi:hypothetical protein
VVDAGVSAERAGDPRVVLANADTASGLADLLHQFLVQTIEASPTKARRARRLAGALVFRAAEDPAIGVRILFGGGRIEFADLGADPAPPRAPAITADFLTTAHLTTGEEGPLALLLRRRLRVQAAGRPLFLLGALALFRVERPGAGRRRRILLAAALVVIAAALVAVLFRLGARAWL